MVDVNSSKNGLSWYKGLFCFVSIKMHLECKKKFKVKTIHACFCFVILKRLKKKHLVDYKNYFHLNFNELPSRWNDENLKRILCCHTQIILQYVFL